MSARSSNRGLAPGDDARAQDDQTHDVLDTTHDTQPWLRRPAARSEYVPFASALRAAMLKNKLSASEVARRIWGEGKDRRGYSVAKNRDRIGHYLAGTSYPEPDNLIRLADAVGVSVDELTIERRPAPLPRVLRGMEAEPVELQLTSLPEAPSKARLQVNRVLDWETALRIVQLIKEDERRKPDMPPSGRSFGKPEPELRGPVIEAPAVAAPSAA